MEIVLKEFQGYSGSKVFLIQKNDSIFIRKINNIERNYERLNFLYKLGYKVPKIYKKEKDILEMEYVKGLDMKTYFNINNIEFFLNYLFDLTGKFYKYSKEKNYIKIYDKKLSWIDENKIFPFTKIELINSLPAFLPQSVYHGDFTLENIIYNNTDFYLIDGITSEYDSWVFDLAKLRQDLNCFWLIRNIEDKNFKRYLSIIDEKILEKYPILKNNSLLILMLLRIYPYIKNDLKDKKFILREIERLWK